MLVIGWKSRIGSQGRKPALKTSWGIGEEEDKDEKRAQDTREQQVEGKVNRNITEGKH